MGAADTAFPAQNDITYHRQIVVPADIRSAGRAVRRRSDYRFPARHTPDADIHETAPAAAENKNGTKSSSETGRIFKSGTEPPVIFTQRHILKKQHDFYSFPSPSVTGVISNPRSMASVSGSIPVQMRKLAAPCPISISRPPAHSRENFSAALSKGVCL